MKDFFIASLLALTVMTGTPSFSDPTNVCRWTSDTECKEKVLGSRCGSYGTCFAEGWSFSEPECKCYEKPDDSKNFCRWTSDTECKGKLPGRVRDGLCRVDSVLIDEPSCKFSKD